MKIMKCYKLLLALLVIFTGSSQLLFAQSDYDPTPPNEPGVPVFKTYYTVSVKAEATEACNVSSTLALKSELGKTGTINTSAKSTIFKFKYWKKNGEITALPQRFNYTVNDADGNVEFVACYDYDPSIPKEPTPNVTSVLYLQCDPDGACSFNRTSGAMFTVDSWVDLTTVANANYRFVGWYDQTGKLQSNAVSFNFQMPYNNTTLTAKYVYVAPEYDPAVPGEPSSQGGDVLNQLTGDVNKDGVIDTEDAVRLIEAYLDATSDTVLGLGIYDYNNDGVVDTEDAVRIIEQYLNSK